ncbi:MAG: hypothetical protein OXL68_15720 [Paracoccaceae bacterium]|nr:hypothetical protein [Paracoccaceae bacterium]
MALPLIPATKAVILLAAAWAALRRVGPHPLNQTESDRLDQVAEGVHASRHPGRGVHGAARWRRRIRFGPFRRWLEIDASALGRIRARWVGRRPS